MGAKTETQTVQRKRPQKRMIYEVRLACEKRWAEKSDSLGKRAKWQKGGRKKKRQKTERGKSDREHEVAESGNSGEGAKVGRKGSFRRSAI